MSQHRSISQRLAKAKSPETKREVVNDWIANWYKEQLSLIAQIEKAINHDDYDQLCIATGQLKAATEKRFTALPKVIQALVGGQGESHLNCVNSRKSSLLINRGKNHIFTSLKSN